MMPVTIGDATLFLGDCLDVLRAMPDNSLDSVVTDPPYGLAFMGKKWDYDVPDMEVWVECLRVLKPGGHLLAFAGTRTQHRMACRIEDAGFEIRDMIAWVYGSGFPKSLDVSKAIDKAAGAARDVLGVVEGGGRMAGGNYGSTDYNAGWHGVKLTTPATDASRQWDGWGTALKPALEPITLARKPFACTVAANVLQHGTGALNIDASRIETASDENLNSGSTVGSHGSHEGWRRPWMDDAAHNAKAADAAKERVAKAEAMGRWPANLIHDGGDEVIRLFPERDAGGSRTGLEPSDKTKNAYGDYGQIAFQSHGDTGSAARFFYCAKASKDDRSEGLVDFDKVARNHEEFRRNINTCTGRPRGDIPRANTHPTVKPTDLMHYLLRLVTPPGGVALDPFMGSGSTGKAAAIGDFKFIGIERDPDYFAIACARLEYAHAQGKLFPPERTKQVQEALI